MKIPTINIYQSSFKYVELLGSSELVSYRIENAADLIC
jgi:hypothetical protein